MQVLHKRLTSSPSPAVGQASPISQWDAGRVSVGKSPEWKADALCALQFLAQHML